MKMKSKTPRTQTFLVLWKAKGDTNLWMPNRLYVRAHSHQQIPEMFRKAHAGDILVDIYSTKELKNLIEDIKHCAQRDGFWPAFDVKHKN
jgi:hypothetical protein